MSRSNDQRLVVAKLKYVGWVEDILELNYEILNLVVMLCNQVKANYVGSSATIKRDEYGFTLVNFGSLIPILNQLFIFLYTWIKSFFLVTLRKEDGK